jgi:hypothetical protein
MSANFIGGLILIFGGFAIACLIPAEFLDDHYLEDKKAFSFLSNVFIGLFIAAIIAYLKLR